MQAELGLITPIKEKVDRVALGLGAGRAAQGEGSPQDAQETPADLQCVHLPAEGPSLWTH